MAFPIDEKYIVETEDKLKVCFPEPFRQKMMIENGGSVDTPPDAWVLYPFFDTSSKKRLKRTFNSIARETQMEWDQFRLPKNAVAIGANGGGDLLVFLRAEHGKSLGPAVHWWDHETGQFHFVCSDFSELI